MTQQTELVFSPRWEYDDTADEAARKLRDEAMAVAALAHHLSPDNTVRLHTGFDFEQLDEDGLFRQSFVLFDRSLSASDQSIFSRFVTRHHYGRAELLAARTSIGDAHRGLSEIRSTLPTIRREAETQSDPQTLINVLGGAMLAEAGFGLQGNVKKHRRELRGVISAAKPTQIDISSLRNAVRTAASYSKERIKRHANSAAALAVLSLRDIVGSEDAAQSLAQRALRGPILHKPA